MGTWRARVLDANEALLYQWDGFYTEPEARVWVLGVFAGMGLEVHQYDMRHEEDGDGGLVTGTVWVPR